MKLPRSSYYYHSKKQELLPEDQALVNRIEEITEEFPKYGYRKVTRQLHREAVPVNHKKVHRIMREKGLLVTKTKRFVKTTDSNHPYPVYPNLIKDLQVTNLNQVWVADITYIRIAVGFVYLAVILDLCSRKAIGYAISRTYRHILEPLSASDGDPEQKPSCRRDSSLGPGSAVCSS